MRILFLGDIVGEPGRKIARKAIPLLRLKYELDLVIVNAENCAGGSGINGRCHAQLADAGVQAITMGDHIYKNREIFDLFDRRPLICRPANYPPEAPGPDHVLVETADRHPVAVISVLGRVFMKPVDCPLHALDRVLEKIGSAVRVILVDVHAEATSDKQTILRHLIGRVSAVLGTCVCVPTADAAVYPPGTAYITDLGMTGPYDGVIGRRWDRVLHANLTFEPNFFEVASGDPRISGVLLEVDADTGRASSITPLHLNASAIEELASSLPAQTVFDVRAYS